MLCTTKQHSQMGPSQAHPGPIWHPTLPNWGPTGAHMECCLGFNTFHKHVEYTSITCHVVYFYCHTLCHTLTTTLCHTLTKTGHEKNWPCCSVKCKNIWHAVFFSCYYRLNTVDSKKRSCRHVELKDQEPPTVAFSLTLKCI